MVGRVYFFIEIDKKAPESRQGFFRVGPILKLGPSLEFFSRVFEKLFEIGLEVTIDSPN
jgi:hypothetical protein